MTTATTAIDAHRAIEAAAQQADPEVRRVDRIAVGEYARQGDIYVERIADVDMNWPLGTNRQLAPGTTQGSRHVVAGDVAIRTPPEGQRVRRDGANARLLGPQLSSAGRVVITHPEHAHLDLPPGCYQVSYQLDWARQQAVRD